MNQATSKSRNVLVTGGCTGIGRAIADAFSKDGCRVWATSIHEEDLDVANASPGLITRMLDVTDVNSIQSVLGDMEELDVLVNCAGTIVRGGLEHDPLQFARVVDVNLTGTMRMCQAAHQLLLRRSGCVVNMASMLSVFGSDRVPAYSSSKGGIVQLTRSLAIAWADDGIRVNAIAPGWIKTQLTEPLVENHDFHQSILARTPLRRWGEPGDIAPAVLFLCSPGARFITGSILTVDGGYSVT